MACIVRNFWALTRDSVKRKDEGNGREGGTQRQEDRGKVQGREGEKHLQ